LFFSAKIDFINFNNKSDRLKELAGVLNSSWKSLIQELFHKGLNNEAAGKRCNVIKFFSKDCVDKGRN